MERNKKKPNVKQQNLIHNLRIHSSRTRPIHFEDMNIALFIYIFRVFY